MAYVDRVQEIAGLVAALPGAGIVHDRLRLSIRLAKYVELFADATGRVNGWEITRGPGTPEPPHWLETYILRKIYGMRDEDATDHAFQEQLDAVVRLFRDNADLSFGAVPVGARIEVNEPRMFGGVLCHYAECHLQVGLFYRDL